MERSLIRQAYCCRWQRLPDFELAIRFVTPPGKFIYAKLAPRSQFGASACFAEPGESRRHDKHGLQATLNALPTGDAGA